MGPEKSESRYGLQVELIGFTSELKVACERERQVPSSMLELAHTRLGKLIVPSLLTSLTVKEVPLRDAWFQRCAMPPK